MTENCFFCFAPTCEGCPDQFATFERMKYGVYSIRDARTGFLPPTVDQNDSSAMRNFAHACMQKESLLFSHIEDYALCKIGEFDNETGTISTQLPEVILDGTSIQRKEG